MTKIAALIGILLGVGTGMTMASLQQTNPPMDFASAE